MEKGQLMYRGSSSKRGQSGGDWAVAGCVTLRFPSRVAKDDRHWSGERLRVNVLQCRCCRHFVCAAYSAAVTLRLLIGILLLHFMICHILLVPHSYGHRKD
jgi:hypothetical protein